MKYLISFDYQNDLPYYLQQTLENKYNEIYNPHFAAKFDSVESAKEWGRIHMRDMEYTKIVCESDAIEEWQKFTTGSIVRRVIPLVDLVVSLKYDASIHTPDDVLKMRTRSDEQQMRYEDSQTWPQLYNVFEHIFDKGRYMDDEKPNQFVYSFTLKFKRNSNLTTFKNELLKILNKVTYKSDGYKVFDVIDHDLNENRSGVNFHYKTYNDCRIVSTFGDRTIVKGSLKEMFDYLCKHHYY